MILGKKRVFIATILFSAIVSSNLASAHTMVVIPDLDQTKSSIIFQIISHGSPQTSEINAKTTDGKQRICASLKDPRCSEAEELKVSLIVPTCTAKSTNFDVCIRGVDVRGRDAKIYPSVHEREVATTKFSKNVDAKIGNAGGVSIWKVKAGVTSESSDKIATKAVLTYSVQIDKVSKKANPAKLVDFAISAYPVSYISGNYEMRSYLVNEDGFEYYGIDPSYTNLDDSSKCEWTEKGICVMKGYFAPDTNISISLQMDNKLQGWLTSNILDLKIEEKKLTSSTNLLTVGGRASNPSPVYAVNNVIDVSKLKELEAAYNRCGGEVSVCGQTFEQFDNKIWEGLLTSDVSSAQFKVGLADVISLSLVDVPDQGTKWNIASMPEAGWRKGVSWSPCVSNSKVLAGVVSTNASLYQMNPPELVDQKLVSRVEGAHHNSKHELNRVDYQVAMRGDVFRCLLKKNTNPTSVKATAFSSAGEVMMNPAVQMVEQNGWVNFAAKNFSYSTPNVEFVFSTPVVKTVSKTISCAKGKKIVKVKGVAPKCPKGYVKK